MIAESSSSPISISSVILGDDVEEAVLGVLRSGVIAQGPVVAALEHEFASMIGVDHVVAVNNGTTALVAALKAAGVGPGHEVITSPFTFVATLNAILDVGATARFADISTHDFNVTPEAMASLIGPSTKALLPVHLYGQAADMVAIEELARLNDLELIEDAALAHGAVVAGRSVGSFGIGCFSLYATKNLTSGEGGLISTNDASVADHLRVLRNQGMRERYQYEMAGSNYRMTDLQAAVCLPQLGRYGATLEARRRNADWLSAGLADLEWISTPSVRPERTHVWHQYTILLAEASPITRDELAANLATLGIGSGVYYPRPVYDYDCYRNSAQVVADPTPVASAVASRCLALPVHPGLTEHDLDRIVDGVRQAFDR